MSLPRALRHATLAGLTLLSIASACALAALPPGVTEVTSVEGITEYRLDNGLRALLFPDPSKETITVNITYLVGSRHENYGETGMAHLLEHLLFKGSTNHPHVPDELTEHGARPNGTTWFDRTNYFESFTATEENLTWALDLEADRMVNSFIAKKDLDTEFSVVRNEFEMGENNPQGVLEERVLSTSFLWHNYGNSTIGARTDIENVPIDRLQAFYRNYYQPDNAILAVAGDFDVAKTLELIAAKFGPIPRPTRELQKLYTIEPAQDGERTVSLRRVGDVQALCVAYHVPAGAHSDFAALEVLAFILADAPSGRLYKELVETKLASSVQSYNYQLHDPGVLLASVELRKENSLVAAEAKLLEVLDGVATHPVTEDEVRRARESLLKNWEMTLLNSERAGRELSEWAGMGDWRLMFLHRDRLQRVNAADVQRVAAAYLKPGNRTVGNYIPTQVAERVEIPSTPDVTGMLANYKGGAPLAEGEDFDPTPANIEGRVIRTTLPNGLDLILLPKKTRGGSVFASLNLHFGDEKSLAGKRTTGDIAGSMLMRGTSKHDRQQIRDEIDRLKARLMVFGEAQGVFASLETTNEHASESISLLGELLRESIFPESEFDLVKEEMLADIEEQKSDPGQMVQTAWARHGQPWSRDDVRYAPTPDEQIADVSAVTAERVRAFHQDFYGASSAELAIVGDFDVDAMTKLAGSTFGGWTSKMPYARVPNPYRELPPGELTIEAPDKENASFRGGQLLELGEDDPDFPALTLGNFMTGGGFLNSRLAVRLRQKDGVSYGTGSMLFASPFEKRAVWAGRAIYAPQNLDKVMRGFNEEVGKVLHEGFSAEEVNEAKSGWLQSREVSRGNDGELVSRLAARSFEGRTLEWDEQFESQVEALTPEQILQAMQRHLDLSKMVLVRAGDFAKVRAQVGQTSN